MSCGLFVPEVHGSQVCAVCRRKLSEHDRNAIYVEPRRIFTNLPPAPPPANKLSMSSLATSEHSAFSPYARPIVHAGSSPSCSQLNRDPPPIIRPLPRLGAPVIAQDDRSDSCIYKKIRSKRKERSSSVGELRSPSPDLEEVARSSHRSSPVPTERSADFKKILQRFQSAEQPQSRRYTVDSIKLAPSEHSMSPAGATRDLWSPTRRTREVWSPTRTASASREWSPAQRSSLNSNFSSSPVSRNTSGRSRMSTSSLQSPLSFLPTRESSPRSAPSPSMIPLRVSASPEEHDVEENPLHTHSPLSHTGSTPEPLPIAVSKKAPLMVSVPPIPKRRSLPGRSVKETDIDAPLSVPMSPFGSPSVEGYSQENVIHPELVGPQKIIEPATNAAKVKPVSRFGGSCRRVLSGLDYNKVGPNGVYVRRSRSKDDRPLTAHAMMPPKSFTSSTGSVSRSLLHNIPIFFSSESVRDSPKSQSPARSDDRDSYKHYQQIALSHVQTLSAVADRLAEDQRRGDEPVSRNKLNSLDFSHFIVQPQPALTKGKSLFYNAVLPRSGQSDYPVTLMIAPCSQYAPLMRRGDSQTFAVPGFLEMEDHDGSIRRFLEDTGTHNLDGRNTKVIAMPRLNLCSFHSLAAHYLTERSDRASQEELVSFILLQLMGSLKMLQSEGVEALSANFKEFLLAYRFSSGNHSNLKEFPRLIFLPETLGAEVEAGGDELVGLCRYALRALCTLLHHKMDGRPPPVKLRSRFSRALQSCANLLAEDKSSSLTQAKNVLELALWWNGEPPRFESDCRKSLDLARAECVDQLLRQLVCEPGCHLGARERLRVEFLLGATPRSLIDSHKSIMAAGLH